jgi:hypothetical protein
MSAKLEAAFNPYPIPTPERRAIVVELSEIARALDDEAATRTLRIRTELQNSAGTVRLVATLVLNGSYSEGRSRLWLHSSRNYLSLVQSSNDLGVIA